MITLKSKEEIKLIREGGKILSAILNKVAKKAKAGVTTMELDQLAESLILEAGGEPSFKGYGGKHNPYPATLCISTNEELVHGIPGERILKSGDIVGLDIGMRYPKGNGLYTDMAVTVAIGKIDKKTEKLMSVTKKSLELWIRNLKPGIKLNDIATKVQKYIEGEGFSIVRDLVGHGVGHDVHEDPPIPNYAYSGQTVVLKEGMVLAIEPMVSMGHYKIVTLDDGWTVSMKDLSYCAHYEHTIAILKDRTIIITK